MRIFFFTLIGFQVCLLMAALDARPHFFSINSYALANKVWKQHPTKENEAAWLIEKESFENKHLAEKICIYGLLAINAFGLFKLFRHLEERTRTR